MSYSPNQILEDGGFQDFEGNPLALGYLLLELSHDEQYTADDYQVVAGFTLKIPLDAIGNINPTVAVYSNDVLAPANSYYIVRAYKADGTQAWASPQYWQIPSSPNPFNPGTLVPTNPPGGIGAAGGLTLQTNGTNNSDQNLLNLANGTNITITNSAGTTTISASGGASFSTSGYGGFWGPGYIVDDFIADIGATSSQITNVTTLVLAYQFVLQSAWTISKCTAYMNTNTAFSGNNFGFGIYSSAGSKLVDSGAFDATQSANVALTNSFTPVSISPGVYYFAQTCTLTTISVTGFGGSTSSYNKMYNANGLRTVVGSNAPTGTGSGLPATLGTLANMASSAVGGYLNPASPFWEP